MVVVLLGCITELAYTGETGMYLKLAYNCKWCDEIEFSLTFSASTVVLISEWILLSNDGSTTCGRLSCIRGDDVDGGNMPCDGVESTFINVLDTKRKN